MEFAELASSFSTAPATSKYVNYLVISKQYKRIILIYSAIVFLQKKVNFHVMVFVSQVRGMLMKAYKTVIKKEKF